jgi:hypothetical protein
MPERKAIERARADKRAGKSPSTQAGEFVKEEVDRVRAGEHGVRSARQAVAIGLSKARRAGVDLQPPARGTTSETVRKKAEQDAAAGQGKKKRASTESKAKRARTSTAVLQHESQAGASKEAMSKQAKSAAKRRPAASRSTAAKKAAQTKGAAGRSTAAKKAAQTRVARAHHGHR